VKGRWTYLYRAVDKVGRTVDFYRSERRDVNAAKHFFRKAMKSVGTPRVITLDAYAASHRAVRELKAEGRLPRRVRVRSSKYLNHMMEQDVRRIKQRSRPMLGFKRFDHAAVTISGIELVQKIQKHQFKTGKLGGRSATMPELWNAVLAARSEISEIRRRTARLRTLHQSRPSDAAVVGLCFESAYVCDCIVMRTLR